VSSTVICLHSGGFTSRQWKRLAQTLAPTHHVIAPDLIGYGAEPWPTGEPFHYQQDVDVIVEIVRAQVDPVHLVGHSYGGFLACHIARAVPVASLALYEPVTFSVLDPARDADAIAGLQGLRTTWEPDDYGVDEPWLATFVDWWNGAGAWAALPPETKGAFRAVGWKVFREVITLGGDTTGAGFAAISVPTLVMTGARSPLSEQRTCERLAELLPRATLRRFEGVGHMAPITHHAQIDAAIVEHVCAS
jgi:pimeloyl-ACP methyl ester carboxylesterase